MTLVTRRQFLRAATTGGAIMSINTTSTTRAAVSRPRHGSTTWPRELVMGTAAAGGVYEIYGPAWGRIVQNATGVAVEYQKTDGANENILRMHRPTSNVHLSMVTMGIARQGWFGVGSWTDGRRFRNMRALFPMYETIFHGVTMVGGSVERLAQLQNKSIGVGPRGSTPGIYFPAMMTTLGIPVSTIRFGDADELTWQLRRGLLDAFLFASGSPIPAFVKIANEEDIIFLDFAEPELDWLRSVYPETYTTKLAPGTYKGQSKSLNVLGMFNFAICVDTLPDDLVYTLVKSVMTENTILRKNIRESVKGLKQLENIAAQSSAKYINRNTFLPFHCGAARYYHENGHLDIPLSSQCEVEL